MLNYRNNTEFYEEAIFARYGLPGNRSDCDGHYGISKRSIWSKYSDAEYLGWFRYEDLKS